MLLKLLLTLFLIDLSEGTKRPIIGILAQKTTALMDREFPGHQSYIAASYVKAVQSSGARVVPIFTGHSQDYYKYIVRSVNGVLFPGGSTWFYDKNGFVDAAVYIMEEIKALNSTNYPLLGVCLGFELMLFVEAGRKEVRTNCSVSNVALPLELEEDFQESRLFKDAPQNIIDIIRNEPVTMNFHRFCITAETMNKMNLTRNWKILSTNYDDIYNLTFVSSIESKIFPFVGVQFHPEKYYEWRIDLNNPHSFNGILAGRYFFDWLVLESKKNNHSFESVDAEKSSLISNYPLTYSENKVIFDQLYLFDGSGAPSTTGCILLVIIGQILIVLMNS